jgi:hypothetical protein
MRVLPYSAPVWRAPAIEKWRASGASGCKQGVPGKVFAVKNKGNDYPLLNKTQSPAEHFESHHCVYKNDGHEFHERKNIAGKYSGTQKDC